MDAGVNVGLVGALRGSHVGGGVLHVGDPVQEDLGQLAADVATDFLEKKRREIKSENLVAQG